MSDDTIQKNRASKASQSSRSSKAQKDADTWSDDEWGDTVPDVSDATVKKRNTAYSGLYIVPTPIGNLGDITYRAVETLKQVDMIACEDTRVSKTLCSHYDIRTPLKIFHEHSGPRAFAQLLDAARKGSAALISDAGTPMISDPGQSLIQQAQEQGIPVHVLPGACAAITALVRSGQSAYHFTFAGFLPPKTTPRRKALQSFVQAPGSLIFYESPHRIAASLKDMAAILQDRPATVARELTKRFEEITHGSLVELADLYASKPSPKGEIVVIVGENNDSNGQGDISDQSHIDALLREALGRARLKEAVKEVSVITGAPRNEIYARALLLSQGGSKD